MFPVIIIIIIVKANWHRVLITRGDTLNRREVLGGKNEKKNEKKSNQ